MKRAIISYQIITIYYLLLLFIYIYQLLLATYTPF